MSRLLSEVKKASKVVEDLSDRVFLIFVPLCECFNQWLIEVQVETEER